MVKNILKIYKKIYFYSKKKILYNEYRNQFDFIYYTEIAFLSKTQWRLTCAEDVHLLS